MDDKMVLNRGDIYFANLGSVIGSEQRNHRPVLIIQNEFGNEYSPTVIIIPLTGKPRNNALPTHVKIPRSAGLDKDSIALVEQLRTIDRIRLIKYIGQINENTQNKINNALSICTGLEKRRSPNGEMLVLSLCRHCEYDFRNSGYLLIKKGWQENMNMCDFCKNVKGLTFGIFNLDGGE